MFLFFSSFKFLLFKIKLYISIALYGNFIFKNFCKCIKNIVLNTINVLPEAVIILFGPIIMLVFFIFLNWIIGAIVFVTSFNFTNISSNDVKRSVITFIFGFWGYLMYETEFLS